MVLFSHRWERGLRRDEERGLDASVAGGTRPFEDGLEREYTRGTEGMAHL